MNKLGLLICLIAISFTTQKINLQDIDIPALYDKVVYIAKGMCENTEYKCSNNLVKNKEALLKIINDAIEDYNKGTGLVELLAKYAIKLYLVKDFMTDCKVAEIGAKVVTLTTEKGLKDLGYNIIEYTTDIINHIGEFKNAADLNDKLVAAGKILKVLLGIAVK